MLFKIYNDYHPSCSFLHLHPTYYTLDDVNAHAPSTHKGFLRPCVSDVLWTDCEPTRLFLFSFLLSFYSFGLSLFSPSLPLARLRCMTYHYYFFFPYLIPRVPSAHTPLSSHFVSHFQSCGRFFFFLSFLTAKRVVNDVAERIVCNILKKKVKRRNSKR